MGLAFVLLLQVAVSNARGGILSSAAHASARPRECAALPFRSSLQWATNVWDAARDPNLARYCDLLGQGFAQLPFSPENARATADGADRIAPGHAAPSVLRGRALSAAKRYREASVEFARAQSLDAQSLDDPATMQEWARSLARTGRREEALGVYRLLGPRLSLVPSPDERERAFIEGAELALALGPGALDDAVAFLGEARQVGVYDLEWRVGTELALAYERRDDGDHAAGVLVDLARRFRKGWKPKVGGDSPEELAALAFGIEGIDPKQALDGWQRYLAAVGPQAPWAEHARRHVDALRKKGRGA
ncbi:MAG TPA: hypothetical protein VJT73_06945 [Polyangiaceae bacterium]|nr:hypothetical protein [Polyangiaceae bacterium]